MKASQIKFWAWVHKYTSLICTIFMLMLCITGLPLIFTHEIHHLTGMDIESGYANSDQSNYGAKSIDEILSSARKNHPDRVVQYAYQPEDDNGIWYVILTPTPAPTDDYVSVVVDANTAQVLAVPKFNEGFMWVMLKLHVDMFAGLWGKLFLGFMGVLLALSIISGTVLYAPFMKRLNFGQVRRNNSTRAKWLDIHNLLGIVTLVWLLTVGLTGTVNTLAELLIGNWQAGLTSEFQKAKQSINSAEKPAAIEQKDMASIQAMLDSAIKSLPDSSDVRLSFISFPGTAFATPEHAGFVFRGKSSLESHLIYPVFLDAKTGEVTASPRMPWYLTLLSLSGPLHFGDYAGLPMKVIWAVLDILSIILLSSGLYLWLVKKQKLKNSQTNQQIQVTQILNQTEK